MQIDINLIMEEYKKQVAKLVNDNVILTCQVNQLTREINRLKNQMDQLESENANNI